MQALHRTSEFDLVDAGQEVAKCVLELETGDVGAQAEVLTDTEREVAIRVTGDAKLEGVLEDLFITIRRGVEECQVFALGDLAAAKLGVLAGGAAEVDDRTRLTDDLFDPGRE